MGLEIAQPITLDVSCLNNICVYAKQGDKGSRFVMIQLTKNGDTVVIGTTVSVVFKKKNTTLDGVSSAVAQIAGGVRIEIPEEIMSNAAEYKCEVSVVEASSGEIYLVSFALVVEKSIIANFDETKIPEA